MEKKLVRDRIPLLVPGSYYRCDKDELSKLLRMKLAEEVIEYLTNPSPEELADVLEVIARLMELEGKEVINALIKKRAEKGAFEGCWVMVAD